MRFGLDVAQEIDLVIEVPVITFGAAQRLGSMKGGVLHMDLEFELALEHRITLVASIKCRLGPSLLQVRLVKLVDLDRSWWTGKGRCA